MAACCFNTGFKTKKKNLNCAMYDFFFSFPSCPDPVSEPQSSLWNVGVTLKSPPLLTWQRAGKPWLLFWQGWGGGAGRSEANWIRSFKGLPQESLLMVGSLQQAFFAEHGWINARKSNYARPHPTQGLGFQFSLGGKQWGFGISLCDSGLGSKICSSVNAPIKWE